MNASATQVSKHLASLQAGEQSWFWFSPDVPENPLLLLPFSQPGGMDEVQRISNNIPRPLMAYTCTGISSVAADGTLQFGSTLFQAGMLPILAEWVRANVADYPALAKLVGCRFFRIADRKYVVERFEDASLWQGFSRPLVAGTVAFAAAQLQKLKPGEQARVWFSEDTPDPTPLAYVFPVNEDKDGSRFSAAIIDGRQRSQQQHPGLRGLAYRTESNMLVITTLDALSLVGDKLSAWLAPLGPVILSRRQEQEIIEARRIGGKAAGNDLSGLVACLRNLDKKSCLFWFTSSNRDGKPQLLVETDGAVLKAAAMEAKGKLAGVRGTLHTAKWGIELRARKPYPNLLPALAKWVRYNRKKWPAVDALIGARVTVRDKEGNILERIKDTKAWSKLQSKES